MFEANRVITIQQGIQGAWVCVDEHGTAPPEVGLFADTNSRSCIVHLRADA
jgi:hypothetical protein